VASLRTLSPVVVLAACGGAPRPPAPHNTEHRPAPPALTAAPPEATGGDGISGTITFAPAVQGKVRPGNIFVLVKRVDAGGQPTGMPLAIDRVRFDGDRLPFLLDQTKQMISGPAVIGDVVVLARWDQDDDAITKQPGDITGTLRVTAPAQGVQLVLDTILP
jgi:hypothetical protein